MSERHCTRCERMFECRADTIESCWCADYPWVGSLEADSHCLCPTCLAKAVGAALERYIETHGREPSLALARAYAGQKPLVEHIDYTVEQGLYVFSRWFHLKRGHCCGNACRNCPFDHQAVR